MFSRKNYFYIIAFLLMATTYFPLLFNNLPPIFRSHHIWTPIWVISLLIFYPKIFLNKLMLLVFGYAFFLFIGLNTFWINMGAWNVNMLYTELYSIAIGVSIILYFIDSKDYYSLARLVKWTLVFILITAIMSIVSSRIDPMYARNITGAGDESEMVQEMAFAFKRYGGGTYGTAIMFMSLIPLAIFYFKNSQLVGVNRIYILIFIFIIFYALLGMQFFANIILAAILAIWSALGRDNIKKSIIITTFFIVFIYLIPQNIYITGLRFAAERTDPGSELNYKFNDLANYLGVDNAENQTATELRADRYPMLFETFIKSPFLGCYFFSDESGRGYRQGGGHLHWMNKLTTTGIIGLLIFLFIPYFFLKKMLNYIDSKMTFFFFLSALSIILYGLMKTIVGREVWYAFFVIIPGICFLPISNKNKNQNKKFR